jgi:SMODS-associating 4TM effector domain
VAPPLRLADATPVTTPAGQVSALGQRAARPHALMLFKAYSRGYLLAGRWHNARTAGTAGFALVAPIITFWWTSGADLIAAAASGWLLIARAVLGPAEDRERRRAVNAQEMYDTEVFGLDWNLGLAGPRPAEEDLVKAAGKHRGDAPTDWYADTEDLPSPLDIVLSQRSSAVWGRGTHFAYAIILAGVGTTVFIAGVTVGGFTHLSLTDYLVRLFLPSVPALLDTIDLSRTHWSTSRQKGDIEMEADTLWSTGVQQIDAVTDDDCRRLQDQVYRLRLHGPRVATWLYKMRRGNDDRAMREAVAQRIAEYRAAHPGS